MYSTFGHGNSYSHQWAIVQAIYCRADVVRAQFVNTYRPKIILESKHLGLTQLYVGYKYFGLSPLLSYCSNHLLQRLECYVKMLFLPVSGHCITQVSKDALSVLDKNTSQEGLCQELIPPICLESVFRLIFVKKNSHTEKHSE